VRRRARARRRGRGHSSSARGFPEFDWTSGPGFAYKEARAHGRNPKQGEKTMASKKSTKKLKKPKALGHTKTLDIAANVTKFR
jgi:hypothetical protein